MVILSLSDRMKSKSTSWYAMDAKSPYKSERKGKQYSVFPEKIASHNELGIK